MLYAIPVFFILIGIELIIEKFQNNQLYRFNDAYSNISCGITQQIIGVFYKSVMLLAYYFLYTNFRLFDIPNTWWSYILLFLGIDCLYYFFHRYSHEINAFWGTHVVHHQSEDYNLSVALRQSAFQGLISGVFYLPLALIGFDPIPFLLINTLQTLYQFWIHTETIQKLPRWFEYIFNTPSHHRVHHGRNPEYIDKNHGGTLIVFDRLFGTFQDEEAPVVYGVTKSLSTWNPLWANIDYYKDLFAQFKATSGIQNKMTLLIQKPGWRPEIDGGPQFPPEVNRSSQTKYHTATSLSIKWYIAIHFILALGATTYFLATIPKVDVQDIGAYFTPVLITQALVVILTVTGLGLLADNNVWGKRLEMIRLLLIGPLAYYVFGASMNTLSLIILGSLILCSIIHLYFISLKPTPID